MAVALVAMMACNSGSDEWQLVWADEFDGEQIDDASWTRVPTGRDDWNIYAAEVYRDSVCFYVNGAKTLTYPRVEGMEYQFPFPDKEMHIRLSNQLGGGWVGPVSNPEQLPAELRIDYVRVYQKEE